MWSAGVIADRGSGEASPGVLRADDGGLYFQAGPIIAWSIVQCPA